MKDKQATPIRNRRSLRLDSGTSERSAKNNKEATFFLGGGATLYADLRMAQFHSAMSETSKIAGEPVLTRYLGT